MCQVECVNTVRFHPCGEIFRNRSMKNQINFKGDNGAE